MGEKSVQKKKYILEKAKEVFCARGYYGVTMKDIVEACDISRGGLYLYFADTKELFEAILEQETESRQEIFQGNADDTPGDILLAYLSSRKKEILKKKDNLSVATCEYLLENGNEKKDNPMKKQFQEDVKSLEKLISDGVAKEWMVCENPAVAARNIMFTLEGLTLHAQTLGITADVIDKEIEYIMGTVGLMVEG